MRKINLKSYIVKQAAEKIEGFGKNDVEFVQRILDAEAVDVKEKGDQK